MNSNEISFSPCSIMFRNQDAFHHLSRYEIATHLRITSYRGFHLTNAVRPSYDLQVIPAEGFRYEYVPGYGDLQVLVCAASCERMIQVFHAFVDLLGDVVDIILESSHHQTANGKCFRTFRRSGIDKTAACSYLHPHRESFMEDGCLGLAIVDPSTGVEMCYDEHKLFRIYTCDGKWGPFVRALNRCGLYFEPDLRFITDGEHIHISNELKYREFCNAVCELGAQ